MLNRLETDLYLRWKAASQENLRLVKELGQVKWWNLRHYWAVTSQLDANFAVYESLARLLNDYQIIQRLEDEDLVYFKTHRPRTKLELVKLADEESVDEDHFV